MIRLYLTDTVRIVRYCGPGCWNAKRASCRCICGGAQHGIKSGPPATEAEQKSREEDARIHARAEAQRLTVRARYSSRKEPALVAMEGLVVEQLSLLDLTE